MNFGAEIAVYFGMTGAISETLPALFVFQKSPMTQPIDIPAFLYITPVNPFAALSFRQ